MVNFTQSQLNTARIVWDIFKQYGYNNNATAGVIGNIFAESELDPNKNEDDGGPGYGLGQWTPKSNLYQQAAICGISRAEAETARGQAIIMAQGDRTGQWLNAANTAYHSAVITPQTLAEFKRSTSITAAAANFCAHWERPEVPKARMSVRIDAANSIYALFNEPEIPKLKELLNMEFCYRKGNAIYHYVNGTIRILGSETEFNVLKAMYNQTSNNLYGEVKNMLVVDWANNRPTSDAFERMARYNESKDLTSWQNWPNS